MLATARLWLWLGQWAAVKGLDPISDFCLRTAAEGGGNASAEAMVSLGKKLIKEERHKEARNIMERAVRAAPRNSRAWSLLGVACRRLTDMPAAREAYQKALDIDPDYLDARTNLGEWYLVSGDISAALQCFDAVLRIKPLHLEATNNRTAALIEAGRHVEAEQVLLDAIARYPDSSPLQVNLGNVYSQMAKGREAANAYRKALELDPDSEEATLSLATLLGSDELLAQATEFIKQQIAIRGESVDRLGRLAMAQMGQKAYPEARKTCEKILAKKPNDIVALVTLGNVLGTCGDPGGGIAYFRRAIELRPELSSIHSNILFESTYLAGITASDVFTLHTEWAQRHEAPLLDNRVSDRWPEQESDEFMQARPIRIGYVSGDFGTHPVGFLIRDILRDHDKSRFEVFCYSQVTFPDHVTEQIKSHADHWLETFFISDEKLAEQIRDDRIDILVDLSGHTAMNRLRTFAMRPAPVQATWIGYFHSTGLRSIDYFITDPYSTPLGSNQLFSETPAYLPYTRFCYSPPVYAPPVAEPPCVSKGYVTLGSFNRLSKLTQEVVECWAGILLKVPNARLLLKTQGLQEPETAERLRARFVEMGIAPERLELRGPSNHQEMFLQYGELDIALDPFPFNGGMTTLEALWMGVPVLALAGNAVVSRQSTSALSNIGLDELIFSDIEAYMAGAVSLANDMGRLVTLRKSLRLRMSRSPLCQPEQFTHDLESLYERMWQAWRRGEKLRQEVVVSPPTNQRVLLHVGCGPADRRSLPPYFRGRDWREVRLDVDQSVSPDVVATMLDMSVVESTSVDAIFSSHNIEHLASHEVPLALAEFIRVLKPDGLLVLTCPDLQSVCALVAEDKLDDAAYVAPAGPIAPHDMIYGHRAAMAIGQTFMAHNTGFTATTLEQTLRRSGFLSVKVARGTMYDLAAISYPSLQAEERVLKDWSLCFPV